MNDKPNHALEAQLRQAAPQADPAFRRSLRHHLLDEVVPAQQASRPLPLWRQRSIQRLAAVAALVIVVVGTLAFTPAGRALAAMLIEWGPFNFTAAPSKAEEIVAESEPAEGHLMESQRFATTTEASLAAGFPVMIPQHVPAGYIHEGTSSTQAKPIEVIVNSQGDVSSVTVDYVSENYEQVLSYMQVPYTPDPTRSPFEIGVGDAIVTEVTVNGNEGVFLEDYNNGTRRDENGDLVAVPYNVFIWQQQVGSQYFLFWLHSSEQLPRDQMLAIAESVSP